MGWSEVKGLWFVVAKRYLIDRYDPDLPARMAALVDPPLRGAFLDPLRSAWYPEACLTQFMRAFDALVSHGDERKMILAFEECTVQGLHRFFQALLRLTSPAFLMRRTPVLWSYMRRSDGGLRVETDDERAIVRYVDFPHFDDVNYRRLALGTLRPIAALGGGAPRACVLDHGVDWLDVEIRYEPARGEDGGVSSLGKTTSPVAARATRPAIRGAGLSPSGWRGRSPSSRGS